MSYLSCSLGIYNINLLSKASSIDATEKAITNINNKALKSNSYIITDNQITHKFRNMTDATIYNNKINKQTINKINKRISKDTNGKIQNALIHNINDNLKLMYINTIHFETEWLYQFDKYYNIIDTFFPINDQISIATYMQTQQIFDYAKTKTYEVIKIELKQTNYVFIIVLPLNINNFKLSDLNHIKFTKTNIKLVLPKFNCTYSQDITNLIEFSDVKAINDNIQIEHIRAYQACTININEIGINSSKTINTPHITKNQNSTTLKINKPFCVYITKNEIIKNENVLFTIKIYNPSI